MRFGLCCSPSQLGFEGASSTKLFHENLNRLARSGAEYVEFPVGAVASEEAADVWQQLKDALQGAPLKVEAYNSFIPAHHRITGPDVDLPRVLEFCRVALSRCRESGAGIVVLGSAGARKVPEGFDGEEARRQFIQFCRELAPVARNADVTICLEPLNHREDNLLLTVEDGARLVDEINAPGIELLADFYHMQENNEALATVAAAGARLKHTHLADIGRVAPGYAEAGEADFTGFFQALRKAGYEANGPAARCSFEGSYTDIFEQASPLLSLLRKRFDESGGSSS